ncbi:MAG: hypothetical protein FJ109_09640 [Deltaproteobacteria bacterium]|nr:hypothetical protein [Deltaproteobacteria bacterium]
MLVLVPIIVFGVACSSAETVRTYPMLHELSPPTAIVLLPAEIHFRSMRAHHYYDYWVDFADLFARETQLPVLGPDDFTLRSEGLVTDPMRETDAAARLSALGLRPEDAVGVRLQLLESWQQGESMLSNGRGESFRGGGFQSRIDFQAEIVHFGTGRPLLALTAHVDLDSLPSPTDSDPRPDVTRYMAERQRQVLSLLVERCSVPSPPAPPASDARLAEGPQGAARQRYRDLPSVIDQTARADEIDREVALTARIAYRHPGLARDVERALIKLGPDTLYVISAAECTGLLPGDVITSVEGAPVSHAYQLRRSELLARAAAGTLSLTVTRAAEVSLPISWNCW